MAKLKQSGSCNRGEGIILANISDVSHKDCEIFHQNQEFIISIPCETLLQTLMNRWIFLIFTREYKITLLFDK